MAKLATIPNMVAWSGFRAFGLLAVAAGPASGSLSRAVLSAAASCALGLRALFRVAHQSEATGHAPPAGRARRIETETDLPAGPGIPGIAG